MPSKSDGVTPDVIVIEPDLLFAPRDERVRPDSGAQPVQRLAKLRTRVHLVLLRPEDPHDLVATSKAVRGGESEVREQCQSLRLTQNRPAGDVSGERQFGVSQNPQFGAGFFHEID